MAAKLLKVYLQHVDVVASENSAGRQIEFRKEEIICSIMSAAKSESCAANCRNVSIFVVLDETTTPICPIVPETARCLLEPEALIELLVAPREDESDNDDLAVSFKHFPESAF
jgi:hypothetical protein